MRVLGVDPGSRNLGFAVIDKLGNTCTVVTHGTLQLIRKEHEHLDADESTPARLNLIFKELGAIIEKFKPQVMAVEKVFFAKNAVSALKLGQARGVVLLTGAYYDLKIFEYSPTEIKSAVTGFGRADKLQVAKMTELILGKQNFKTSDASDALALAVTHALIGNKPTGIPTTANKKKAKTLSLAEALTNRIKNAKV